MKFIAHDHYNNNSYVPASLPDAPGLSSVAESAIKVSSSGIVSFLLYKTMWPEEKLRVLEVLDRELKAEFGEGICAVTAAHSDCAQDPGAFFKAAKEMIPGIITIGVSRHGPLAGADHSISDAWPIKLGDEIVKVIRPGEADRKEPAEGWKPCRDRLRKLYERVKKAANIENPDF